MRQMKFEGIKQNPLHFGGESLIGKRKSMRPLSIKKPLHLVISPEGLSRKFSFIKYKSEIQTLLSKTAKRFGIKIHDKSVNFTHLHLIISFGSRKQYVSFVRVFNSILVRLLEMKAKISMKGLFKLRPFTRIIHWGRDFQRMLKYIQTNRFEAEGLNVRDYKPSVQSYKKPIRRYPRLTSDLKILDQRFESSTRQFEAPHETELLMEKYYGSA